MFIVISDVASNEAKLRMPGCDVRSDGTIWISGMPLIVVSHLPNAAELKAKYVSAVKAKKFDAIAPEHFARLGIIDGVIRVEDREAYDARMAPIWEEQARIEEEREARQIRVFLSTRGWGDYSSVAWQGDRDTPIEQIVRECQELLKSGHDVDHANQTDDEIAAKVRLAKGDSIERQEATAKANESLATVVPAEAVAAYRDCGGDPENFEDDIDDPRYWLVREFAAAIEHQGLARPSAQVIKSQMRPDTLDQVAEE